MGIHFGTFKDLTDEPRLKPIKDLKQSVKENKMNKTDFIAPEFGKEYSFN